MTAAPATIERKWVRGRLYMTAGVMTALLAGIGWKAWTVATHQHDRMHALGQAQYVKDMEMPAPRGTIVDTNGVELAVTVEVESVMANPRAIVDVGGTAAQLGGALGMDVRDLERRLSGDGYFAWVKRRVAPEEARRVRELELPGVAITTEPRRFYPGGALAGTVLGFSNIDGKGIEGLELVLDEKLRGEDTRVRAIRDARGTLVLAHGASGSARGGAAVTLTIDRFLQYTAEKALASAVETAQASAGTAVVMDPHTGRVLALATFPTFDPNRPASREQARNRAVTDVYEPGSVMKAFVVAAALEDGAIQADEWIDTEHGKLKVGRKLVRDTHEEDRPITITEVLKFSSNVGAVKIARRLGKERLHAKLVELGFGEKTGIELPGERTGVLRGTKRWGEIGLATHAYGYGMNATPLQIASALGALANGGMLYPARILEKVVGPDGEVLYAHEPKGRRVFEESVANTVRTMLRSVFEKGGTGQKLAVPGFAPAGKTGTIHKVDHSTGRYFKDRYLSAFAGFVPADEPRLVVVVLIDDPRGKEYYGGAVAGPVFTAIATEGLKYLGVAGTAEPVEVAEGASPFEGNPPPTLGVGGPIPYESEGGEEVVVDSPPLPVAVANAELPLAGPDEDIVIIPSFAGMSMGRALETARAAGVRVELEGSGRAVRQFPEPGRARKSVVTRVTFAPR